MAVISGRGSTDGTAPLRGETARRKSLPEGIAMTVVTVVGTVVNKWKKCFSLSEIFEVNPLALLALLHNPPEG